MSDTASTPAAATGRNSASLLAMLRSRILSGRIHPGEFLPTVRQLSDEHGVSRGTSWRAMKALVVEGLVAAQPRHGYRVLARAGDPDKGTPLAYVLAEDNIVAGWDVYYRTLSASLEEVATGRGWNLVRMITDIGQEEPLFDRLTDMRACGLILDSVNSKLLKRAAESGLPAVVVDTWRQDADFDAIVQDDFGGGRLAGDYLVSMECRRIAWFGPIGDSNHGYARYGGAAAALAAEGLGFSQQIEVKLADPELVAKAREMLSSSNRPQGVVTLWRPVAAAVASAARELGLKIGEDFQMVGWMANEVYGEGFLPIFEGGPVPPAVTWSTSRMAGLALARLAERRVTPNTPTTRMTVPVRLRLTDDEE